MAPVQLDVRDALVLVAALRTLRGAAAEDAQVGAVHIATPGGKDRRGGLDHTDVRVAGDELDESAGGRWRRNFSDWSNDSMRSSNEPHQF
jgi:hypothetical protein